MLVDVGTKYIALSLNTTENIVSVVVSATRGLAIEYLFQRNYVNAEYIYYNL